MRALAGIFVLAYSLLAQNNALLEQADAAFRNGDLDRSMSLARRVLARDPNAVHAHMIVGVIAAQKKEWEVSNKHFQAVVRLAPSNPYGYFYLAKAQYRLGRYGESLNFLAVAESRLSAEPFWLAEVHALRGENYRAQGHLQRAESSYQQALRLNSGNRTANDALARLHVEPAPASR